MTGLVRVGVLDNTVTFEDNIISAAIEAFYQLSDHIEVSLEIGDYTLLNEKLQKNQLDMMIVVLSEQNVHAQTYDHRTPLFHEKSYLYAREDVALEIINKQYSLEGQRINVGGYASRQMHQLLNVNQYDNIKLINGWNVESGLILTMAGTHISFLPTHLIESGKYQYNLVALKEEEWVIESEFSVVLKSSKNALTPVALAFYNCLLEAVKK
ncbi:substrate-binding domain-containing protein [Marinomonas sp. 15G1-11]|uniref:Substrate-binding domain-containing protein n=1 Tax=Marinomonas phaeophyticola TaxID=3004091 RepID=A0ABT4JYY1_9GAMM|nr:substrate-binding domain-containing protein [Marinomonas sp. 15G1-11]MCZ2723610.1 substrate-binding domain-containing protein [Marinomonas sp. 15G1-11]